MNEFDDSKIDYNKIYDSNMPFLQNLSKEDIEKFNLEKLVEQNTTITDPKYHFPNKGLITIAGADKTGKGTLTNHLAYALSSLGHDVLITPFPNYSCFGFFIELQHSYKHIKNIINENKEDFEKIGVNTKELDNWRNETFLDTLLYALDRTGSIPIIEKALNEEKIVLTKRGSQFTHTPYQVVYSSITDEEAMKDVDMLFPKPYLIINLHSKALTQNFSQKGNHNLDSYESQIDKQLEVIKYQNELTKNPNRVYSRYAMFQKFDTPANRLDDVLKRVTKLFSKDNIRSSNTKGSIEIYGREEPEFDFRSKEGLIEFLKNANTMYYLNLLFKPEYKKFENNGLLYENLFTNEDKKDEFILSQKENIDEVIRKYMN